MIFGGKFSGVESDHAIQRPTYDMYHVNSYLVCQTLQLEDFLGIMFVTEERHLVGTWFAQGLLRHGFTHDCAMQTHLSVALTFSETKL